MKYSTKATCGYCPYHGTEFASFKDDVCRTCEVRLMRKRLDELVSAVEWEHVHKYRAETESEFRTCIHCHHVLSAYPLYYFAHNEGTVSCRLDIDNLDDDGRYPIRPDCSSCPKWERHRGRR